ncbi:MAG: glycoside hydrolase family 2 TIM barrel-domain containing protein [Bacteroidales bacterium]
MKQKSIFKRKHFFAFLILLVFYAFAVEAQKSTVRIFRYDEKWHLNVNDTPLYIKGVVGSTFLEKVKEYGGNSIRTGWKQDQLDKAFQLGLYALVNLPAGAERDGMNYDDTAAVRKQKERILFIVNQTKDHPAVLMWAIGNELDYIPPLKPFNPKLWDAINDVAKAIHAADPDHPVMTVIGTSLMQKVSDIVRQCPDLDLLGINSYGDIYELQNTLLKYGWTKPYVVTEWGPDGYWEVKKTPWGAPYEQTGLEKKECYENKYFRAIISSADQCLGSYVFYWAGFKQETTHTWFCMFDQNGLESPLVGLMYYLWTGNKKSNQAPVTDSMRIGNKNRFDPTVIEAGSITNARIYASDPDGDKLRFKWEIRPEAVYASYAGQGEKVPEPIAGLIKAEAEEIFFQAPYKPGPYRLFCYVYDDMGHFSTANLPFLVAPVPRDTVNIGKNNTREQLTRQKNRHRKNLTEPKYLYADSRLKNRCEAAVRRFFQLPNNTGNIRQQFPDIWNLTDFCAFAGDTINYRNGSFQFQTITINF